MTLDLNGYSINAVTNMTEWGNSTAFVTFSTLTNITVFGGTINGQASNSTWWKRDSSGHCTPVRPYLFVVHSSSDFYIHDVLLTNSPMFHFVPMSSKFVRVDNIHIDSPYTKYSCNLDGIDPTNVENLEITNSIIHSGDDCVAIKEGCNNVFVANITAQSGHGFSIGSINKGNVSNVFFHNITMNPQNDGFFENGARIKTWEKGVGEIVNITYNQFYTNQVHNPIIVQTNYTDLEDAHLLELDRKLSLDLLGRLRRDPTLFVPPSVVPLLKRHLLKKNKAATSVWIHDIFFNQVKSTNSPSAATITCLPQNDCINFLFQNILLDVNITCKGVSGKSVLPLSPQSVANCLGK
eukprot:TRINITY_DN17674_c0_g1_i1.p1 TRINITY_DN17674_c0_g1~~TRINITY_DN17674_c0_g1_i1.p1  ORF type:complete len:351 (-),score=73.79 TRINITY_DN17674_c0_g1_i1:79-1131(-)